MNEEIQTPQPNTEQNSNNEKGKGQIIPTGVGIAIALLVVAGFLFLFFKFQKISAPETIQPITTSQPSSKTLPGNNVIPIQENTPPANQVPASDSGIQVSGSNVDIDYELKKLDESANSIDESDFNSGNFTDAQVGL